MSSSFAQSRSHAPDHWGLAPPREGHWLGPIGLALLVHVLLMAALTWGVGWKHNVQTPVFEAELWSALPVQAAPRAEAPPPPPPQPAPEVKAEPRPTPPPPPGPSEADIATQREQKKKEEALRQAELEKAAARQAAADKAAAEKAASEKAAADKAAEKRRATEEKQKQLAEKKAADEQRAREDAEKLRQENIRRMLGQAGASGGPQSTGNAKQSSGPSAGYGARVAARIKPNVVFTDIISGNPRAEVEVRTLPDGTIAGRRIVKSSGNDEWDEAVLKAIDRTASLPRDTDGRVPSSLIIVLQPKD